MSRSTFGPALPLILGLSACEPATPPPTEPGLFAASQSIRVSSGLAVAAARQAAAARANEPRRTSDDDLADLARGPVPGFAGFVYDESGTLVVKLVDTTRASEARTGLAPYLAQHRLRVDRGRGRVSTGADVRFEQVAFDFATLKTWYDRVAQQGVWLVEGLIKSDIDERMNKLHYVTSDQSWFPMVAQKLEAAGVPPEAVTMTTGSMPTVGRGSSSRPGNFGMLARLRGLLDWVWLTQYIRPTVPGMRLAMPTVVGTCSLGINVRLPYDNYVWPHMITASHCSDSAFYTETTEFHNEFVGGWTLLGSEVWDSETWTSGCDTIRCTWTDATLVAYASDDLDRFGKMPYNHSTPGHNSASDLSIESNLFYNIVEDQGGPPPQGQWLCHQGQTSGTRCGPVLRWCVNGKVLDVNNNGYIVMYMCTGETEYRGAGGDSGGPVWTALEELDVGLYGIHVGGSGQDHWRFESDSFTVHRDTSIIVGIGSLRGTFGNFTTY